jgi:hypothetical protein
MSFGDENKKDIYIYIQKIYAPSSSLLHGRGGGIYFLNETSACESKPD